MDNNLFSQEFIRQWSEAFRQIVREELAAAAGEAVNKPEEPQGTITQKELCKFLNMSEQTIIRWRHKGKIPFLMVGTKPRYVVAEVIKAMEKK